MANSNPFANDPSEVFRTQRRPSWVRRVWRRLREGSSHSAEIQTAAAPNPLTQARPGGAKAANNRATPSRDAARGAAPRASQQEPTATESIAAAELQQRSRESQDPDESLGFDELIRRIRATEAEIGERGDEE